MTYQLSEIAIRNLPMHFGSAMTHELVLAEVRLVTPGNGTQVGLDPCMSPHVVISVTDHRKPFRAEFARVWFLVSMNSSYMGLKILVVKINLPLNGSFH